MFISNKIQLRDDGEGIHCGNYTNYSYDKCDNIPDVTKTVKIVELFSHIVGRLVVQVLLKSLNNKFILITQC